MDATAQGREEEAPKPKKPAPPNKPPPLHILQAQISKAAETASVLARITQLQRSHGLEKGTADRLRCAPPHLAARLMDTVLGGGGASCDVESRVAALLSFIDGQPAAPPGSASASPGLGAIPEQSKSAAVKTMAGASTSAMETDRPTASGTAVSPSAAVGATTVATPGAASSITAPMSERVRRTIDWMCSEQLERLIRRGCREDAEWRNFWREICRKKGLQEGTLEGPGGVTPGLLTLQQFVTTHISRALIRNWAQDLLWRHRDEWDGPAPPSPAFEFDGDGAGGGGGGGGADGMVAVADAGVAEKAAKAAQAAQAVQARMRPPPIPEDLAGVQQRIKERMTERIRGSTADSRDLIKQFALRHGLTRHVEDALFMIDGAAFQALVKTSQDFHKTMDSHAAQKAVLARICDLDAEVFCLTTKIMELEPLGTAGMGPAGVWTRDWYGRWWLMPPPFPPHAGAKPTKKQKKAKKEKKKEEEEEKREKRGKRDKKERRCKTAAKDAKVKAPKSKRAEAHESTDSSDPRERGKKQQRREPRVPGKRPKARDTRRRRSPSTSSPMTMSSSSPASTSSSSSSSSRREGRADTGVHAAQMAKLESLLSAVDGADSPRFEEAHPKSKPSAQCRSKAGFTGPMPARRAQTAQDVPEGKNDAKNARLERALPVAGGCGADGDADDGMSHDDSQRLLQEGVASEALGEDADRSPSQTRKKVNDSEDAQELNDSETAREVGEQFEAPCPEDLENQQTDSDEHQLVEWLAALDGGKGALLQYAGRLKEEFDCDFEQISAARLQESISPGVIGSIDPSFWEVCDIKLAGHRLLFAKGILSLP